MRGQAGEQSLACEDVYDCELVVGHVGVVLDVHLKTEHQLRVFAGFFSICYLFCCFVDSFDALADVLKALDAANLEPNSGVFGLLLAQQLL